MLVDLYVTLSNLLTFNPNVNKKSIREDFRTSFVDAVAMLIFSIIIITILILKTLPLEDNFETI